MVLVVGLLLVWMLLLLTELRVFVRVRADVLVVRLVGALLVVLVLRVGRG